MITLMNILCGLFSNSIVFALHKTSANDIILCEATDGDVTRRLNRRTLLSY